MPVAQKQHPSAIASTYHGQATRRMDDPMKDRHHGNRTKDKRFSKRPDHLQYGMPAGLDRSFACNGGRWGGGGSASFSSRETRGSGKTSSLLPRPSAYAARWRDYWPRVLTACLVLRTALADAAIKHESMFLFSLLKSVARVGIHSRPRNGSRSFCSASATCRIRLNA